MEEVGGVGVLTKSASLFLLMLILHCTWGEVDAQERLLQYQTKTPNPTSVKGPVPSTFACRDQSCKFSETRDGLHAFELLSENTNRLEIRVRDDYTAGRKVFRGQVKVSNGAHKECIMQIFGGAPGNAGGDATLFILRAMNYNGGTLSHYSTNPLISNIYNKWVSVEVDHVQDQYVQVSINGDIKGKWVDDEKGITNYHKYGLYHTFGTQTTPSAKVEWSNVTITSSQAKAMQQALPS